MILIFFYLSIKYCLGYHYRSVFLFEFIFLLDLHASYHRLFEIISETVSETGQRVYLIGGFVRDYYLDRLNLEEPCDIDLVTLGSGIRAARAVAQKLDGSQLTTFRRFGTAQVRWNNFLLEFAGARKESYRSDSRKPAVEDGTLKEDQLRRDFTINALSWSLNPQDYGLLNDPFNGLQDLKNKLVRTPVEPGKTFSDDPLRMLRAIRFAAQLRFTIAAETLIGIKEMAHRIEIVSRERICDELNKMVLSEVPSAGFKLMFETGLLEKIFPEMVRLHGVHEVHGVRHKDNFWHTLKVLDNVSRVSEDLWLRWAAIMHDIGKPPTRRFDPQQGWTFHGHDALGAQMIPGLFRKLGLPLDERMQYVRKLVRLHLRPIALANETVTDSAVRRLIVQAGNDIEDLMKLCRADITSKNDRKIRKFLKNFDYVEQRVAEVEEKDQLRNWKPPVTGHDIMTLFDVGPGPHIGKIKSAVEEAILDGHIPNTREAALKFLAELKTSGPGLKSG